ncbi:MAG: hypothetical protein Q9M16_09845 [Mariprofundus sp.]|nr:hypothetical protein [Mariprofundus sp.]
MTPPYRYISLILVGMMLTAFSSTSANAAPASMKTMLAGMQADAEGIVDTALAKDVPGSQKLFHKIQQRMNQLHQHLAGQAFDERRSRELLMAYSWMRVIALDLKQHAWTGTAIAANQLTASVIRFTNYSTLEQRDLAWMDYLARELLLLSMEDASANAQLLDARRANLVETWGRIKTKLIRNSFRNKPLVLRGDSLMHRLQNKPKPEKSMETARELMIFVDEVEQIKQ